MLTTKSIRSIRSVKSIIIIILSGILFGKLILSSVMFRSTAYICIV